MNQRPFTLALAFALTACGSGGGDDSSSPPPSPPPTFVSAPDCVTPANLIAEETVAPKNATFMRVQHMGDLGTAELAGQISNPVTWPVGDLTGFYPSAEALAAGAQRGYRDAPPPIAASAFQLWCGDAGFLINTFQFSHKLPLAGEGPSISLAREPVPYVNAFRGPGSSMTIEANINLAHTNYQAPHDWDGSAQMSFFYYALDTTSNTAISHLIMLFDSRPKGTRGSGDEQVAYDFQVYFGVSPLNATDSAGTPVRYATVGAGSETMRFTTPWSRPILFRAQVTYENFRQMLAAMRSGPQPQLSPRPEDYRISLFGVLGEVLPMQGSEHNVSMGGSISGLKLSGG
jgi:hypothetical protein